MSNRWYGSIENRLIEKCKNLSPIVGMGVTEISWSDRHPYEITKVVDSRHIFVRRLDAKVISGSCQDGSAEYEYTSNSNHPEIKLFLTSKNIWRERYSNGKLGCDTYVIGYAEEYYDPSF